jgi:hypothetical protein
MGGFSANKHTPDKMATIHPLKVELVWIKSLAPELSNMALLVLMCFVCILLARFVVCS